MGAIRFIASKQPVLPYQEGNHTHVEGKKVHTAVCNSVLQSWHNRSVPSAEYLIPWMPSAFLLPSFPSRKRMYSVKSPLLDLLFIFKPETSQVKIHIHSTSIIMLPTTLQYISLSFLLLLLFTTTHRATAFPVRRDLIRPDLGAHNCFEGKRDLIYPDLGAHNCGGGWAGRGYRGGCCR